METAEERGRKLADGFRQIAAQCLRFGGLCDAEAAMWERREAAMWERRAAVVEALLPPADDGEPVTGEWLESVGSREPHGVDYSAPPTLTLPGAGFGVLVQCDSGREWDWRRGNRVIATVRTKGDVRRLCAALGVPLTEAKP